jgi:sec-independent protein translocase protein TatA
MGIGLILAGLGGQELLIIAIVGAVVIFGAAKVPLFMRGVGQGIKEFKQAIKDDPAAEPKNADPAESQTERQVAAGDRAAAEESR